MSRTGALGDTNLRSLLRELRTDIAMAVDDPFPLLYGLVDKNILTDQLFKVRTNMKTFIRFIFLFRGMSAVFTCFFNFDYNILYFFNIQTLKNNKSNGYYTQQDMVLFRVAEVTYLLLFYRTRWRRKVEKGSIRPCTPSSPGSWNREDPPFRLSGATCPKTTTWTATPSCRRCSLNCNPVCNQRFPKI